MNTCLALSFQAASSLQQHESLRPCRRCGSPATHSPEIRRATCTRSSCLYDFCTHCQEAFHGSTPCRVVRPRPHFSKSAPLIAGSARSKKSIRRLWQTFIKAFLTAPELRESFSSLDWQNFKWLVPKLERQGHDLSVESSSAHTVTHTWPHATPAPSNWIHWLLHM